MAEGVDHLESCIYPFVNKISSKQDVKCIGCSELRLELLQVKTEILSLGKIIKMLQEELNMKRISSNDGSTVQGKHVDECFKIQFPKGGWTQLGSKNYTKSYDLNSNLIQLIPASRNRFEVLSNLKEDDSTDASTEDDSMKILNNFSHVKGVTSISTRC
jgi:hypothetical protein